MQAASHHIIRRERDWVLSEFKAGRSPILIATDVASRGLGMFPIILTSAATRIQRVASWAATPSLHAGSVVLGLR